MPERPMVRGAVFSVIMLILAGIFFLFGFSYFGCGIKGPPVPPRQPPVPAVVDLAYQVADQSVTLTWYLPGPLFGKQATHSTFGLYRSRTALAEPVCDGCPLVFEKVVTVPYVHTDTNRFSTDASLDPGYRYVFKVRLETDGRTGPDSNPVQFDHMPDVPFEQSETP
ncbi:MAG: hypothetical protein HGJ93_06850 [Desulfosarcina sp.]|nr:hypothetical protein [Desulfosarcina sp.]MBC2765663.1 hypothetical protein [Desulfosarcina sp.]